MVPHGARCAFAADQKIGKRYDLNEVSVVEAAGVEPASEKARNEENYVRSQFSNFSVRLRTGKSGDRLVRLISALCSGPKPSAYPAR
jgi:hypothetical protein